MKNWKTVKKCIAFLSVAFLAATAARADLLYFMTSSYNDDGDTDTYNFDYVMVGVAQDGVADWDKGSKVYLNIQTTPDSGAESSQYLASSPDGPWYVLSGPAWADVSDYTADDYSFYVETYKNNALTAIWSYDEETAQSYAQLMSAGHIYTDSTSLQNVTPWSVPEPASGILILVGSALLALRRRCNAGHKQIGAKIAISV